MPRKGVRHKGPSALPEKCLPLITIGITCFNAAGTIKRATLSAIRQDWLRKEIVVVDDASHDASYVLLEDLRQRHKQIRLIRHSQNKGYAGALNTIVKESNGEFICIFDDDDESVPQRLSRQWSRITNYERDHQAKLILCYANRKVVKAGQSYPDHVAKAIGRHAPEPYGVAIADYLFGCAYDARFVWGLFGSCTLMARRETLTAIGTFDEDFRRCAEWDLATRAAFQGAHFIAVAEPLIIQHKTPGSEKSGDIPLRYALLLREKHKEYLKSRGFYRSSRAMAKYNYYSKRGKNGRSLIYLLLAFMLSPNILCERLGRNLRFLQR